MLGCIWRLKPKFIWPIFFSFHAIFHKLRKTLNIIQSNRNIVKRFSLYESWMIFFTTYLDGHENNSAMCKRIGKSCYVENGFTSLSWFYRRNEGKGPEGERKENNSVDVELIFRSRAEQPPARLPFVAFVQRDLSEKRPRKKIVYCWNGYLISHKTYFFRNLTFVRYKNYMFSYQHRGNKSSFRQRWYWWWSPSHEETSEKENHRNAEKKNSISIRERERRKTHAVAVCLTARCRWVVSVLCVRISSILWGCTRFRRMSRLDILTKPKQSAVRRHSNRRGCPANNLTKQIVRMSNI